MPEVYHTISIHIVCVVGIENHETKEFGWVLIEMLQQRLLHWIGVYAFDRCESLMLLCDPELAMNLMSGTVNNGLPKEFSVQTLLWKRAPQRTSLLQSTS